MEHFLIVRKNKKNFRKIRNIEIKIKHNQQKWSHRSYSLACFSAVLWRRW